MRSEFRTIALLAGTGWSADALACSACRVAVAAGIFGDSLAGRLAGLSAPLLLIAVIALAIEFSGRTPCFPARDR